MSENMLASSDWATTRGEKWCAQLDGMEAMLARIDAPLFAALQLDVGPYRIADIGCGGGGATLAIARCAPAGSIVHGLDISPVLVETARRRGEGTAAEFHVADAATTVPPDLYDRLASRFGVMFFDDPAAAFGNLCRWLAPGGRFAFAVWGAPSANPWMKIVKDTVAEVIELPPVDPNAPGPFRYADVSKMVAVLGPAGFTDIAVEEWRGRLAIGGGLPVAEAAEFALTSFASFGDLLATPAGREALPVARRNLEARFSEHLHNGVVELDASVHLVSGKRQ